MSAGVRSEKSIGERGDGLCTGGAQEMQKGSGRWSVVSGQFRLLAFLRTMLVGAVRTLWGLRLWLRSDRRWGLSRELLLDCWLGCFANGAGQCCCRSGRVSGKRERVWLLLNFVAMLAAERQWSVVRGQWPVSAAGFAENPVRRRCANCLGAAPEKAFHPNVLISQSLHPPCFARSTSSGQAWRYSRGGCRYVSCGLGGYKVHGDRRIFFGGLV